MTLTKAQRTRIAKRSRAHGYLDLGAGVVQVFCPLCRQRVDCPKSYAESPSSAIDRAMRDDHLIDCTEAAAPRG